MQVHSGDSLALSLSLSLSDLPTYLPTHLLALFRAYRGVIATPAFPLLREPRFGLPQHCTHVGRRRGHPRRYGLAIGPLVRRHFLVGEDTRLVRGTPRLID